MPSVPTYVCLRRRRSPLRARPPRRAGREAGQRDRGGYGIFIGTQATAERDRGHPRRGRRPTPQLDRPAHRRRSRPPRPCATAGLSPRHVDLRPFILSGERPYVTNGGLTRVALREGSLVVNSSQGGGSKDTWIIDPHGGLTHGAGSVDVHAARPPEPVAGRGCRPTRPASTRRARRRGHRRPASATGAVLLSRVAEYVYWSGPLPRAGRVDRPPGARSTPSCSSTCPGRSVSAGRRCWPSPAAGEAFDDGYDRVDRGRRRRLPRSPTGATTARSWPRWTGPARTCASPAA